MKMNRNIGMILLGVYLVIVGLAGAFNFSLGQLSVVVPFLALASGILILIGK